MTATKKIILSLACVLLMGLGSNAYADSITINYSVDGTAAVTGIAGGAYPGDSVELLAYSGSLTLVAGVAQTAQINTLKFDWNYTETQGTFPLDFTRSMTISGAQSIIQGGLLDSWFTNYPYDGVVINAAAPPTLVFNLGSNGTVSVTPIATQFFSNEGAFTQYGDAGIGGGTKGVYADFVWTPVPDGGATLALLGGAMLGLGVLRRKFQA